MKSVIKLITGCCFIALLSGCASVLCGPKQSVAINSRPNGAQIMIYDSTGEVVFKNVTPCIAKLNRRAKDMLDGANYVVLIKKEGFASVQVPLVSMVNRAYFANVLNGGIGLVIDPLTGSMWTLNPAGIDPALGPQETAFFDHEDGLLICLKEEVPQGLVSRLEPVQK